MHAEKDIARLQRVLNCLARVVTKAPRLSRSIPIILKRLHWLTLAEVSRSFQNMHNNFPNPKRQPTSIYD